MVTLSVGICVGAVIGFFLGGWIKPNRLRKIIKNRESNLTLGDRAGSIEKSRAIAKSFYDPEKALFEINRYYWEVDVAPTPFLGHAPTPVNSSELKINKMQMRAEREVSEKKEQGVYRLFITGGSTAFGSGAADWNTTIGGYCQNSLKDREEDYHVFTAACPAWGSTHERIFIENRISELEPNLVVMFSGNNEAHWSWNQKNTLWFHSYPDIYLKKVLNMAYSMAGRENFFDASEEYPAPPSPEEVARKLAKNVKLAAYALDCPLVFVLQPTMAVSKKKLSNRERDCLKEWHVAQIEYFNNCYQQFRIQLQSMDSIVFIDLSEIFNDCTESEEIFLDPYHFGDRGTEIIANHIMKKISGFL